MWRCCMLGIACSIVLRVCVFVCTLLLWGRQFIRFAVAARNNRCLLLCFVVSSTIYYPVRLHTTEGSGAVRDVLKHMVGLPTGTATKSSLLPLSRHLTMQLLQQQPAGNRENNE